MAETSARERPTQTLALSLDGHYDVDRVDQLLLRTLRDERFRNSSTVSYSISSGASADGLGVAALLAMFARLASSKEILLRRAHANSTASPRAIGPLGTTLSSHRISEILDAIGIRTISEADALAREAEHSHIRLLTERDDLQEVLESLARHRQLGIFLSDFRELGVVRTGIIGDIVLYELGNNIFDHAQTRHAYLSIGRTDLPRSASPYSKRFRAAVSDRKVLEVVVSDLGRGIPAALAKTFAKLQANSTAKGSTRDHDLVDFAFEAHATSKTQAERLQRYEELFRSTEMLHLKPPSGLYWIREVAREFRALLTVRSSRALIAYDFLNAPEATEGLRFPKAGKLNRAVIPGTHVTLLLPLGVPERHVALGGTFRTAATAAADKHTTICITPDPAQSVNVEDAAAEAEYIARVVETATVLARQASKPATLALDLRGVRLSTKGLHILSMELMWIQNAGLNIVGYNADQLVSVGPELTEALRDTARSEPSLRPERPLLLFDSSWRSALVGAENEAAEILQNLPLPHPAPADTLNRLIAKHRLSHLLVATGPEAGDARWLVNLPELQRLNLHNLKRALYRRFTNPALGIFRDAKWFLIPSGVYSKGFFDLRRALERGAERQLFVSWLVAELASLNPSHIITVGFGAHELADLVTEATTVSCLPVEEPDKTESWYRVALLPPEACVVVIIGVIGTALTIRRLLQVLPNVDLAAVISVVDCRAGQTQPDPLRFKERNVKLLSAITFPLEFRTDLPPGTSYDDIVQVDRISGAPLDQERPETLVIGDESQLMKLAEDTNAATTGHFTIHNRHSLYFINSLPLVKEHASGFAEIIRRDLLPHSQDDEDAIALNYIAFPVGSQGASVVAEQLANLFDGTELLALEEEALDHPRRFPWTGSGQIGSLVVFDTAVGSGGTFWHVIDLLSSWGAETIYYYALLRRPGSDSLMVHERVRQYDHTDIRLRFLYDLSIPNYDPDRCPLCRLATDLRLTSRTLTPGSEGRRFAEDEAHRLNSWPARLLIASETRSAFLIGSAAERSQTFRTRYLLERAKIEPKSRHILADIARRGPLSKIAQLIEILIREESEFFQPSLLKALFYTSFAEALVEAAQRLLREAEYRNSAERSFYPLRLLGHLSADAQAKAMSEMPEPILRTLQGTAKPRRTRPFADHATSASYFRVESRRPAAPTSFRRHDAPSPPDCLRDLLRHISPSGGPSWPYLHLQTTAEHAATGRIEFEWAVSEVKLLWPEVRQRTHEALRSASDLATGLDQASAVWAAATDLADLTEQIALKLQHLDKIVADLSGGRSLFANDAFRELSRSFSFLQATLFGEGPYSLQAVLRPTMSDVRKIARSVVSIERMQQLFLQLELKLELDFPDEHCFVFGHPVDILTILTNLLENLEHGFAQDYAEGANRKARLSAVKDRARSKLVLAIEDSGRAAYPIVPGLGLGVVQDVAERLFGSLSIPSEPRGYRYPTVFGVELQLIGEEIVRRWEPLP